jgi:hypothetical protein
MDGGIEILGISDSLPWQINIFGGKSSIRWEFSIGMLN